MITLPSVTRSNTSRFTSNDSDAAYSRIFATSGYTPLRNLENETNPSKRGHTYRAPGGSVQNPVYLHPLVGCVRRGPPGLSHERVYTRPTPPGRSISTPGNRVSAPADSPAQLASEVAASVATERPSALMACTHVFLWTQIVVHDPDFLAIGPSESSKVSLLLLERVRHFGRFLRILSQPFCEN